VSHKNELHFTLREEFSEDGIFSAWVIKDHDVGLVTQGDSVEDALRAIASMREAHRRWKDRLEEEKRRGVNAN